MADSRKKRGGTKEKRTPPPILPDWEEETENQAEAEAAPLAQEKPKRNLLGRMLDMLKRVGVMNVILLVLGAGTVAFTLEMIRTFKMYGAIPDTLVQCFFVAVTGECGFMGWIKTSKERRRDRKWQKEDERQAREDMERQSQGPGNA